MKTKQLILVFTVLLFWGTFLSAFSQGSVTPVDVISSDDIAIQEIPRIQDLFAKQTIGISAGFGFKSRDDVEDRTTICFGGEYLRKINDREDCGAYLGGFASYHTSSQDEFKKNVFKVGPKFEYHHPITQSGEAQLVGGLKGFYKTGSEEDFGFKQDLTGYGASLYSGFNIRLSSKWDLGVEFPIVSYSSTKFEFNGNESTQNSTTIALNKRNPLMLYGRIRLD
jgi:hypothetical protein